MNFLFVGGVVLIIGLWCFFTNLSLKEFIHLKSAKDLPPWIINTPIAHRGLHKTPTIPENSLAAFEFAKKNNFGVELDVHLTKDEHVIVFHDENLKRLTGKNALISEVTYAQISQLRLLNSNHSIPTLQQVLDTIKGEVPLYIEIKNKSQSTGPLEKALYNEIKDYKGPLAVISFNSKSLKWFKENAPFILRGQTACAFESHYPPLSLFQRFIMKAFLLNWMSEPHFLIYELKSTSSNFPLKILKVFKVIITYGTQDTVTLLQAKAFADNYMFDHISTIRD